MRQRKLQTIAGTETRFRARRALTWDDTSPFVCVVWERKGRSGKLLADAEGYLMTFLTPDAAETYAREILMGRVSA